MHRLLPILGITFVDILGFSMLIPMLPYFVTHFGASAVVVGIIFAVFSLCQLISGPIWGNVSDRVGRKAVLIVSQIGATIGWAMLGAAPNIFWVFIARIVEGVSGGNIGVTQAYVADLVAPKDRARAFGYISATFGAGMVFGPLGGGLLYARYGFAVPFFVAAGLQFLTLLLTIVVLPESRGKGDGNVVGPLEIFSTFRDPQLSPMLWQKLALSLALYGWFGVMALYLARQLHLNLTQTDYYFSIVSVLNVFVNAVVISRAATALGSRRMSTLGLFALVSMFALAPFVHGLPALTVLAIFMSFGLAFANTGLTALISSTADDRRQGTVLGVTSSLDSFSGIVSPPISTGLLGRYGSPWSTASSLLFATIAFVMGLVSGKRERDDRAAAMQTLPETDPLRAEKAT